MAANAAFKSESLHQQPILFWSYVTCFVRGMRPLKPSISQPLVTETEPIPFEYKALYPVFSCTAEEKEGSFLERIHAIVEPDDCHQAINTTSKIGSTCLPSYEGNVAYSQDFFILIFFRRLFPLCIFRKKMRITFSA